jgi:hypothetical protein
MLNRKTFTTKDTNGCQFKVEATYYGKDYNFQAGRYETRSEYRAMGLMAGSLPELKRMIAEK